MTLLFSARSSGIQPVDDIRKHWSAPS